MGISKRLSTAQKLGRNALSVSFDMFVDRPGVMERLDAKRRKILPRTGAYTMGVMRKSMRKARTSRDVTPGPPHYGGGSRPGEPPRYREGSLRRGISFGISHADQNLVVGPNRIFGSLVVVPELLNEGGVAMVTLPGGRRATGRYEPRPFATADSPAGIEGGKFFTDLIEKTQL